ncbi:MAG TPA: DUF4912 domain-containing protein [Verrucomicrobiae bacterium]|nr:DUF4912 domain-containing protein [Verrucomicrobiae bacterium]
MKARKKILRKKPVAITPSEKIVAKKKSSRVAKKTAASRKNSSQKTISKSTPPIPKKAAAKKPAPAPRKIAKKNPRNAAAKTRVKVTRKKIAAISKTSPAKMSVSEIPRAEIVAARSSAALVSRSPERKMPANVPAILLEGDSAPAPSASGPGKRYVSGWAAARGPFETESEIELPESYGTQNLLFTARDPHWLYAHWDISREQQQRFNSLSVDRHLVLRIHSRELSPKPEQEIHVHPESRHWFVHVNRGGEKYIAELGYYSRSGRWTTISISVAAQTPPDTLAENTSADFATLPLETPMANLLSLVEENALEKSPQTETFQEPRAETHSETRKMNPAETPRAVAAASSKNIEPRHFQEKNHVAQKTHSWTPAQERALAEMVSMDHVRRVWTGSLEIAELIRGEIANEFASIAAQPGFAPTSPVEAPGGISSAQNFSAPSPQQNFWFNVNAELVIYGATERDANVTIGGRKIRLRPDGTFSYRFALPDGNYELPIVAVSADGTDGRGAEMKFARETEFRGDVGVHPQDSALKNPLPENV